VTHRIAWRPGGGGGSGSTLDRWIVHTDHRSISAASAPASAVSRPIAAPAMCSPTSAAHRPPGRRGARPAREVSAVSDIATWLRYA
jgi:hypothetical protein